MIAKRFQTVEQIDQRFVWLDKEIEIAQRNGNDTENPHWQKFKTRWKNLCHEKRVLEKRRQFLLTPQLL